MNVEVSPGPEPDVLAGARKAAAAFFPDATRLVPLSDSPDLTRVEDASGNWYLRRWPREVPPERVALIHGALERASSAGVEVVPRVAALAGRPEERIIVIDGALYDAQSALPGRPLARPRPEASPAGGALRLPAAPSPEVMAELIETIARWHVATAPLATAPGVPAFPLLAMVERVRDVWRGQRERLIPLAAISPAVRRWLRLSAQMLPQAATALEAVPELTRASSVVGHFALWPAHVLIERTDDGTERLSGLIDFRWAAAGSAMVDLAHLSTHFGGWTGATAEETLGRYSAIAPLPPTERRLLPMVAALDLIAEAGTLLEIAFRPPTRDIPTPPSQVRTGAVTLVNGLEALERLVGQGDTRTPSRARPWVHRPKVQRGR
ncbi:MAG: aminoglycoside phosphotransferase family protein [Chloroflexota bacterium]|nr:aminoglycoside phosphotransferase family protein [Chloroflexota bacterium]